MKIDKESPECIDQLKIPEKILPLRMWYMYKNRRCTLIDVDEAKQLVKIVNYTPNVQFRAFGSNENPGFGDYQEFLESRCFSRSRDKLKIILDDLDLPYYDPFLIIKKTQGRMAEDDFWINIER